MEIFDMWPIVAQNFLKIHQQTNQYRKAEANFFFCNTSQILM